MGYIEKQHRDQLTLFPDSLDSYVSSSNPVRVIEAFVNGLRMKELGFIRSNPAKTGRPGYDPADLLKLFIYGYINRIQSSRSLEKETHRNVELMWLIGNLKPNFKTIADFRKENATALKNCCRKFTLMCRELKVLTSHLVAIDGSVFKASNNKSKSIHISQARETVNAIDALISRYFEVISSNDKSEDGYLKAEETDLESKLEKVNHVAVKVEKALAQLDKKPEKPKNKKKAVDQLKASKEVIEAGIQHLQDNKISNLAFTDPDARRFRKGGVTQIGYNTQIAVEHDSKLIISHDLTQDLSDRKQLHEQAKKAMDALGKQSIEVYADKGYHTYDDIANCEKDGIKTYVPEQECSPNSGHNMFTKTQFIYDSETDRYRCPDDHFLTKVKAKKEKGYDLYTTTACADCKLKINCTIDPKGRRIKRDKREDIVDKGRKRLSENPEAMKLRRCIVEHPFGVLKQTLNMNQFLTRGISSVSAEMSLAVLSFNLKRLTNIMGVEKLVKVMV